MFISRAARRTRKDKDIMAGGRRTFGRDTVIEKMWRLRGVLAVASVPLLLIFAIVTLMPTAPKEHLDFSHHSHLPDPMDGRGSVPHGVSRRGTIDDDDIIQPISMNREDGQQKYAVVFDAGSTGSRVHVFRFDVGGGGELALVDDTFEQLKPGLSSFAKNPAKGAASLKPLLDVAMKTVPGAQRRETTVEVRATAGLRMLPGSEADSLLAAVRDLLRGYPFKLQENGVTIMDGAEEGAFQWLTMNYLLGNLEGDVGDTVATVDLGGGSVQLAYAAEAKHAQTAPAGYFKEMRSGANMYHVYVYSHLGYGLMAARAAVLGKVSGDRNPCVPAGHKGEYTYGGKTHAVVGHPTEPADAMACKGVVDDVLATQKPCEAKEQKQCSFNGVWDGSRGAGARTFYLSSYLFDRVSQAGLVDPDAPSGTTTPGEILVAAKRACVMSPEMVKEEFHGVEESDAAYYCHDLSYAHSLLVVGYKIEDNAQVTLVKQVVYKGQNIEAAWPLGAAINALSAL